MINDFVEYWVSARLLLTGGNPYSPAELLALERSVGWSKTEPLIMWNPPWTLSFIVPFGMLDYDTAQLLCFLIHTVIIFVGTQVLWRLYGGERKKRSYALIAVLSFIPVYFVLLLGQIGPLILLGVIAFLYFTQNRAWLLAGASVSLIAVKPHLLYLIWIVSALWVLQEHRWRMALGSLLAGLIITVIPLFWNSAIYLDYVQLLRSGGGVHPTEWATPTLGTALGAVLGDPNGWIRWLPTIGGTLWFLWYWSYRRKNWNWISELPLVLIVSVATASFAWTFDYVVLLPAVIQSAVWMVKNKIAWQRYMIVGVYIVLSVSLVVGKTITLNDFWYFWFAPMILLLYLYTRTRVAGQLGL